MVNSFPIQVIFSRSIKFHMSTENFADTQEKAQLVRDFLMDSKTFQDYGIRNAKVFVYKCWYQKLSLQCWHLSYTQSRYQSLSVGRLEPPLDESALGSNLLKKMSGSAKLLQVWSECGTNGWCVPGHWSEMQCNYPGEPDRTEIRFMQIYSQSKQSDLIFSGRWLGEAFKKKTSCMTIVTSSKELKWTLLGLG